MFSFWFSLKIKFLLFLLIAVSSAQDDNEEINCAKTIWGGPAGPNRNCVFPFKMQDRTFNQCTVFTEKNKRPWCATEVNEEGEHEFASNNWGYCDRRCSFVDGNGEVHEPTTQDPNSQFIRPTPPPSKRTTRPTTTRRTTTSTTTPSSNSDEKIRIDVATLSGTWLPQGDNSCGEDLSSGFIHGGTDSKRGEFPFAALLGYEDLRGRSPTGILYLCGGTLINRRYVVSAAHCHDPGLRGYEVLEVVLGEHDFAADPDCDTCVPRQKFLPEKITLHEKWTSASRGSVPEFDISLIRLDRHATFVTDDFATLVMPVCLEPIVHPDLDTKLMVTGWGQTDKEKKGEVDDQLSRFGVANQILQKLQVPIVTNEECNRFFPGITPNNICAGGILGEDSCNGDSGGGLVTESKPRFFIGIVSSGSRLCGIGEPGIYIRVEKMYPWIKDHLEP